MRDILDKHSIQRKKLRRALNKIKEFDGRGLLFVKSEYVDKAYTATGYVVDRRIFKWSWRILLVFLFVSAYIQGWNVREFVQQYSVECPSDAIMPCENPFYLHCPLDTPFCSQVNYLEYLQPGDSYGRNSSSVVGYAWFIFSASIIIGLIINHFKYNKGVPFVRMEE